MRPPGAYKLASRNRAFEAYLDPGVRRARRARRIVESLRTDLLENVTPEQVRIRRVFSDPREVFRLEIELPDLGYQRTTLLDREALEALLESEHVRDLVRPRVPAG